MTWTAYYSFRPTTVICKHCYDASCITGPVTIIQCVFCYSIRTFVDVLVNKNKLRKRFFARRFHAYISANIKTITPAIDEVIITIKLVSLMVASSETKFHPVQYNDKVGATDYLLLLLFFFKFNSEKGAILSIINSIFIPASFVKTKFLCCQ